MVGKTDINRHIHLVCDVFIYISILFRLDPVKLY